MGLLDTFEAQQALGLLAAAGPRSDGAGFFQRMQEGLGSADQWKRRKAQDEFQQMQMDAYKAKLLQEKQMQDAAMAKRAVLPTLFSQGSNGAAPLSIDSLVPPELRTGMMPQAAVPARQGGINLQAALSAGYTPDEIHKLDSLRNVGMDEVARTVKGLQNGREVEQQFDKFGRPVGQGMEQFRAPIEMNTGARKDLLDPYSLKPKASFAMEQSPDSKASNQVAWANNAVSRERLNFDKQGGADAGKPTFNADTGSFIYKPDAANPNGRVVKADGFQKPLGETAKKTLSGVESLNGAIGEYLTELNGWGASDALRPDKRAAMGTKYNNMMLQAKEAYNLGVLNGPDFQILQSVVTDPRSFTGSITSNKALGGQAKELSRIMSQITAPAVRDSGAKAESTQAGKTVVKTGMYGGKKVVQYSDGTTDYAN